MVLSEVFTLPLPCSVGWGFHTTLLFSIVADFQMVVEAPGGMTLSGLCI